MSVGCELRRSVVCGLERATGVLALSVLLLGDLAECRADLSVICSVCCLLRVLETGGLRWFGSTAPIFNTLKNQRKSFCRHKGNFRICLLPKPLCEEFRGTDLVCGEHLL